MISLARQFYTKFSQRHWYTNFSCIRQIYQGKSLTFQILLKWCKESITVLTKLKFVQPHHITPFIIRN